jgi:hypothetical protein
MNLPNPEFQAPPAREIPAIVRVIRREDVVWNRPTFKAPPLVVVVPSAAELFAVDSRSGNQASR